MARMLASDDATAALCKMSEFPIRQFISSRLARLLTLSVVAFVAFAATPSAGRISASRFDALPKLREQLAVPIWLPNCQMQIVEWRATETLLAETTSSPQALAVIDDTCRTTFARYGEFLRRNKLPRVRTAPEVLPALSLLPGNTLLDGKSPRALNDLPTRFEAVAPGCCYWGLYVDSLNHLFLRNDPLIKDQNGALTANPRFVRTFTHEISHILSARLGVWTLVGYDRSRDESLAEDFVAFMGMHFPAESSAEDLAFHRSWETHGAPAAVAATSEAPTREPPSSAGASANTSPQR